LRKANPDSNSKENEKSDQIPDSPGANRDLFIAHHWVCDLHVHTSASDGILTPQEVFRLAVKKGLKAIAICDHDTVSGFLSLATSLAAEESNLNSIPRSDSSNLQILNDGCEKGRKCQPNRRGSGLISQGVEVIPGIEINSEWQGREVHILGYYIRPHDEKFQNLLERLRKFRCVRVKLMVEKLESLGMPLDLERVFEIARGDSVGRPHVAKAMVEKGYVASVKEAFTRYLGTGKPGYVERLRLDPGESVGAVVDAGGVAVWAHPGTTDADYLLSSLIAKGLAGIEVYHPQHDRNARKKYLALARQNNLIVTGGSDFHGIGANEGGDLGSSVVSYEVVCKLKKIAQSQRGKDD